MVTEQSPRQGITGVAEYLAAHEYERQGGTGEWKPKSVESKSKAAPGTVEIIEGVEEAKQYAIDNSEDAVYTLRVNKGDDLPHGLTP